MYVKEPSGIWMYQGFFYFMEIDCLFRARGVIAKTKTTYLQGPYCLLNSFLKCPSYGHCFTNRLH